VLSLVGCTGLMKSATLLTTTPSDLAAEAREEEPGSPTEAALVEANERLVAAMITSPAMKATFVANLLASALLLAAAFLLLSRRRSALFWTQQALTANVLHAIGFVVAGFYFAGANEALLGDLAGRLAAAQGQDAGASSPILGFATGTICTSALMLGVYAIMLRAVRSERIRGFVLREVG